MAALPEDNPAEPGLGDRARRERWATDHSDVYAVNGRWKRRFHHVFESPNSLHANARVERWIAERVAGRAALDIGCGLGEMARTIRGLGAGSVLGLDVSEKAIEHATRENDDPAVRYAVADADAAIPGRFAVIHGNAILHHLDYRPLVKRWYEENLDPGGRMVFREPSAGGWLMSLWWWWGTDAHTDDEAPLRSGDLRWFRATFPRVRLAGMNYLSFPAAMLTTHLCATPDNALLRAADAVDRRLESACPWLVPRYRYVVVVVDKPGEGVRV